ncbi:hypothetical protein [Nitrosomonas supralitoralis]|uniref:Uncharacterized protein n=1 Tax=Nitrosomonas supralitoralis TaxID=2116706 RepID=A0A2P7NTE6_9PROT|nr:hypothetical protein [Nitrosomonas supralitoralis]PSJ16742.1 hypothetical protein C7H79_11685 [Nitrosomonas supralitoralis]
MSNATSNNSPSGINPPRSPFFKGGSQPPPRLSPPFGKGGRGGISKPKPPKTLPPLTAEELAELPELREGWIWIRLGDIFTDNPKNGIYKSAENYGSGFSIIRIDDFYDGVLCRTSGFKKIKLSTDEIRTFTAHVGDILINRVNSIEYLGKCCEIRGLSEPIVFESNIMKITLVANLTYFPHSL